MIKQFRGKLLEQSEKKGRDSLVVMAIVTVLFLIFFSGLWRPLVGSGIVMFFFASFIILPFISIILGIMSNVRKKRSIYGLIGISYAIIFLVLFQKFFFI